jgi:ketosteroid isomerase-like protein
MGAREVMGRYVQAVQRGDWGDRLRLLRRRRRPARPGRSALAGEHRGREAARAYLDAALARSHGARVEVELVDTLASKERVALVVRERFQRPGGPVEIRRANLYRVRGDQIVEVSIFEADQYKVDQLFEGPPAG